MRRGVYKGPLVMNWVAIGGGMDAPNIYNLANFLRAMPDGAMLTVESSMRNVLPINMMGIAMGLHVRCGIEDNLWNQSRTAKMTHRASRSSSWCASRASSAARSPPARKRARSARSACSTTPSRRRWRPTASRRTAKGRPAGLPAQGGLTMTRHARRPTVLIVPGLRDHVAAALADAARPRDAAAGAHACRRWAATTSTARRASRRSSARRRRSRAR